MVQLYLQSQPPGTSVDLPIPIVGHTKIHVSLLGTQFGGLVKELPHQVQACESISMCHVTIT